MASELKKLANDLRGNANRVQRSQYKVVRATGRRTTRMWALNARATARRHGKHYPQAISSDESFMGDYFTTEVGPDKGATQGPLGNILEYGSRNNPAHKDGDRAFDIETPRFIRDMEKEGDIKL